MRKIIDDVPGEGRDMLVATIGKWLDGKGVAWSWRNEFTGEIHKGYDGLAELCSGGVEAAEWFRNVVQPVIGRMVTP